MYKEIDITVSPKTATIESALYTIVAETCGIDCKSITGIAIKRRSIDARKRTIRVNLRVAVWIDEPVGEIETTERIYPDVSSAREVVIIGAGPAGLFAALRLIERGLKPVIYERGKSVDDRKEDLSNIHNKHIVNPDSNYAFGEGGAGTFSDGKLYTRSKKRGNTLRIIETLHAHGAQDSILIDAHPHIGTNKLPQVIKAIRSTICNSGGEVHFNSRVTDITLQNQKVKSITLQSGEEREVTDLIMATGHSARDIYSLLSNRGVALEAKSFAMGVRIEHPQALINEIQYHNTPDMSFLPPASYNMATQVGGRGVYSFCMCPGGVIVPAATSPNELVVNGMSPSERGGKFANAGMVVEVRPEDISENIPNYLKVDKDSALIFAGLHMQIQMERNCFAAAGKTQNAPAQRMVDFVNGSTSSDAAPSTSYKPGLTMTKMNTWLPKQISQSLRKGLKQMGQKSNGFLTNEATIIGAETRTSSPIRIPRDRTLLHHISITNLYPSGEGAGYAGGIVSSAIDGERCADSIADKI